jgi:hypothetical protein
MGRMTTSIFATGPERPRRRKNDPAFAGGDLGRKSIRKRPATPAGDLDESRQTPSEASSPRRFPRARSAGMRRSRPLAASA